MNNLVYGLGFNDNSIKARATNSRMTSEYRVWTDMLRRCTDEILIKRPTYLGCEVSENFKIFTFFHKWCNEQIGFNSKDDDDRNWHLDKDLLVKGNKIYSEDTCVFIPNKLNGILLNGKSQRGDLPRGVCWYEQGNCYRAQAHDINSKKKHIGYYKTVNEAFIAYKFYKENVVKQVAEQYKSQIDPRAYKALIEYEVHITD